MRLKRHSVVADFAKLRQAKNLESPAVGQYGAVPSCETVQPSMFLDDFVARTEE
jgi:hypothetical protein